MGSVTLRHVFELNVCLAALLRAPDRHGCGGAEQALQTAGWASRSPAALVATEAGPQPGARQMNRGLTLPWKVVPLCPMQC